MAYFSKRTAYQPHDEIAGYAGYFTSPLREGSDDDAFQTRPMYRVADTPRAGAIEGYYPQRAPLFGSFFKIGYRWFIGVNPRTPTSFTEGESDRTIGRPLRMRPPTIPVRSATIRGVRNGINDAQTTAYGRWRVPLPLSIRR